MGTNLHPTRVFIVDDHTQVLHALSAQFSACPELALVGLAAEIPEALRLINLLKPEVVLVETKRADGRGLHLIEKLLHSPAKPHVVVLTSYFNEWEREALTCVGIREYLLKDIGSTELIKQLAALTV